MDMRTEPMNRSARKHTRKSRVNPVKRKVFLDRGLLMLPQVLNQFYELAEVCANFIEVCTQFFAIFLVFRMISPGNQLIAQFDYFPDRFGLISCTGCGRCIDACMGKIDMREIFKRLAELKDE